MRGLFSFLISFYKSFWLSPKERKTQETFQAVRRNDALKKTSEGLGCEHPNGALWQASAFWFSNQILIASSSLREMFQSQITIIIVASRLRSMTTFAARLISRN